MKLLFLVAVASLAAAEPVFAPGQLAFQPSNQIYYNAVPQQPHQPQHPISYNLPFYQVIKFLHTNNQFLCTWKVFHGDIDT